MTAFATTADVQAAWHPLTDQEIMNAEFLLEFASEIVRAEVPTVDARIAAGTLSAVLVKGVVVAMVVRAMKNPESLRSIQESIEDYSRTKTIDSSVSMGSVYLSEDECYLLTGKGQGAFSIKPSEPVTTCATLAEVALVRARRERAWDCT